MADAEVKLNFTAQVEQARAAIAEIAAAMEKLQGSGGLMRPEDAALLNEMQGQLVAYKARLDELSEAYRALQSGGGQANEQALAQIRELQEEVARLTKTQDDLLRKIVDLQVANNELKGGVKDVSTETAKAGQGGVRVTRSLRGVIAGFVTDLVQGKASVRELGLALSGLAKSTGILFAIDLAVRAITAGFGMLKDALFGTEEEAEALKEAIADAAQASKEAADKMQEAFKKAHDEQAAARAKAEAEALAAEYERQAAALRAAADEVQRQAKAEANMRALKAADEDHALAMKRLELDTQLADGQITQKEYRDALLALDEEKAKVQARRTREQADADFKAAQDALDFANLERENARKAWADAQKALDGMVTPERIEQQKNLIASLEAALRRVKLDIKENGVTDANLTAKDGIERQLSAARDKLANFGNGDVEYKAVKAEVDDLRKRLDAAIKAQRAAEARNGASYRDRGFKYAQAGQQERQAADLRGARAELNAVRDRAEKRDLQGEVNALVKEARRAAKSKDDTTDDTAAFRAISDFIKKQGDEVAQYGVNVKALIAVCDKLNLGANSSKSRISALEREIKALQRKVDRTNSQQ